MYTETIWYEKS